MRLDLISLCKPPFAKGDLLLGQQFVDDAGVGLFDQL